jgi:Icc-related predicted phosphoesterase
VGDVHLGPDLAGRHRNAVLDLHERADLFLIAGDLTRHGTREEAQVVAEEYRDLGLPVVTVLGNHDHQSGQQGTVRSVLEDAGIVVLEGESVVIDVRGMRVGVAGAKGFGLGFAGRCGSDFGEDEMKAFARAGREAAERLQAAMCSLDTDVVLALMHYAPVDETLVGEPPEIWPFLGNYLLGEAVDAAPADLAMHGHAHAGVERGITPGGVRVRNVAQPVLRRAYALYDVVPHPERHPRGQAEPDDRVGATGAAPTR